MLQIYALCCGYLAFDRHLFFPDHAPGMRMTIPVSSYLLIHPKGRLLFDTGVHCQVITDPVGRLGARRRRRRLCSRVMPVIPRSIWTGTCSHRLSGMRTPCRTP